MATLSSLGVGSGLDAESIVKSLVALERKPAEAIKTENNKLETKVSTWGKIQSAFSTLQDATDKLNSADFWTASKATSSSSAVSVSTQGSNAANGSYDITVQALASSQSVASAAHADKNAVLGTGTLTIEFGSYGMDTEVDPPVAKFNARSAASEFNITIGPEAMTLEEIRNKINSSGAGVTATLVNDVTGTRLVLQGGTGAENAFRIKASADSSAEIAALAYDPTTANPASQMIRTQVASNAEATINGLSVSSASNTMSDVLEGVTLQLNQVSSTASRVQVSTDTDSITKGIEAFVNAYNDVVSTIRVQTKYDEASKTSGPLQGDAAARGLLNQMRGLISASSGASSVFGRLSDMGMDINTDGTIALNKSKLTTSMGNLDELRKFFSFSDATTTGNEGMARRIKALTSQVLGSEGTISTSTDGIKGRIERNKDKIERIDAKAVLAETRLRAQYTLLDTNMSKLNGLADYVTAQLAALNNNK